MCPPLLHPQGPNGHWWLKVIGFMFNLLIGQMTTAHYTLVDDWCPDQYCKVLTGSISALIIGIFIFINI